MSWPWEAETAVDARLYAHHRTTFTVSKSYTWRGAVFAVTNSATGAAVMEVETVELGYRNLRSLVFLDAASRRPLLTIEELGTSRRRLQAWRGGGASLSNRLLVAVDESRFFKKGDKVEVFLNGRSSGSPDLTVSGSYDTGMIVSRGTVGGEYVARVDKETKSKSDWLSGEHTYKVRIGPGVDQAFVLALAVILDQKDHYDVESSSCSCHHSYRRSTSRTDGHQH